MLSCSSGGPVISEANLNAVTMYYLKDTYDAYDASLYKKVVTSTTCDSTAATKADIAKIQEKVADTGWIEVEFPKNTNFDPASYLMYRRGGNMVSFYGEFRITKNEDSSNYIHLLFKNLPKEDVAPKIFSLDRFINAPYAKALVAVQRDSRIIIGVWMEVRVNRDGWVSIDFRTYSEEPVATGNVYTLNVTYML